MDRHSKVGEDAWPQAPSQEEWEAMTPEEQIRALEALPGEVTYAEMAMPEGERHERAKVAAAEQLKRAFRNRGRKVYVASELPVYYPEERRFAPDVLVVLDVERHIRDRWVVSHEGKGLDWVLEVHAGGDRKKDALHNVERYARLGIAEYFIFNAKREELRGYRLPEKAAGRYVKMKPQEGRYESRVLGLGLSVEAGLVRFWRGTERIPALEEMDERVEEQMRQKQEARQRAAAEARRRQALERQVAQLRAELEQLKGA